MKLRSVSTQNCRGRTGQTTISIGACRRFRSRQNFRVCCYFTNSPQPVILDTPSPAILPYYEAPGQLHKPLQTGHPFPPLAYEVIEGALVRFSSHGNQPVIPSAPTVVLVHGILGSRRNLQSFARMLVEAFPSWQALLVDLPCHGDSASLHNPVGGGPHGVASSASSILSLLRNLKLFPRVLIGHSFGGKVVMSMAQQFGTRLPRPVTVWVLDALPGEIRMGTLDKQDHPLDLIRTLQRVPMPVASRNALIDLLLAEGFSAPIARWMTTNLKPLQGQKGLYTWAFNLEGVAQMYQSYEDTCLWSLLGQPPDGLKLKFVKAEKSNFRWQNNDEARITDLGHQVSVLQDAGHWVHSDNPRGLLDLMASSFGDMDLHMKHSTPEERWSQIRQQPMMASGA